MVKKSVIVEKIEVLKVLIDKISVESKVILDSKSRVNEIQGEYNKLISEQTEFKSLNDVFLREENNPGRAVPGDFLNLKQRMVSVLKDLLYLREIIGSEDE